MSLSLLQAQTTINHPDNTHKIFLTRGQKITVVNTVSVDASLSAGMNVSNNSTSENLLEVKDSTGNDYTISSSLTKMKLTMNMAGQETNYDSDNKADQDSEMGKAFSDKLNKPVDIILDAKTGKATPAVKPVIKKEATDEGNPLQGLLNVMGNNGADDATVASAFELIPDGKKIGDNWTDSTVEKDVKVVRTFTLFAVTDKESMIKLNMVMTAANTYDVQGMQMEFNSTTSTTGEIVTDNISGLVKKKTTQSDITGSFQIMGQSLPISAKANTTSIYRL